MVVLKGKAMSKKCNKCKRTIDFKNLKGTLHKRGQEYGGEPPSRSVWMCEEHKEHAYIFLDKIKEEYNAKK